MVEHIAFMGGGNMASAIISGLLKSGFHKDRLDVVEPFEEARARLLSQFGITAQAEAGAFLERASIVIWAVKPQTFKEAAGQVQAFTRNALHISVAAGIRSDSIARWLGVDRIIRTMPNTPSLLGLGMTGLYAPSGIEQADRDFAEQMMQAVGKTLWVAQESGINGVIAASGSAPAYFFLFMQGIAEEAEAMGFSPEQARLLVQQTALGAAAMVEQNPELSLQALREQVTSKGGTTAEAVKTFQEQGLKPLTSRAMQAAVTRAAEMETLF